MAPLSEVMISVMPAGAMTCIILPMVHRNAERRRQVARNRTVFASAVGVLLLAVVIAAVYGCGGEPRDGQRSYNVFKEAGAWMVATFKVPDEGRVVDGKLITFRTDIQGVLPAAEPPGVITRGNPDLKRVALTLDDGWNADMRILDLLKEKKVKFTAFLIGGRGVVESNPGFVKAIKDAGGEVCGHTWTHYVMRGKDEATMMMELWKTQEAITAVTGEICPYVRFSGGAYDQPALDLAAREGFRVVNWTISNNDTAAGVTVESQVSAILSNLQPGAIILAHWGGYNTYEVLLRAIPEIEGRGYEVTSLTGVFEGTPYLLEGTGGGKGK